MKKILLLFVFVAGLFISQQVKAANYHIDENAVDQLFDNATEANLLNIDATMASATSVSDYDVAGKDPIIAIVLDVVVGTLGIHRFYMGTEVLTGLLYPITCGGIFGVVPLIDLIVMIINYEDISAFIDNPNFFMWKDQF